MEALASVKNAKGSLTIGEKLSLAAQKPSIKNETPERIVDALRYCFSLIGLRPENYPIESDTKILIRYLTENLSRFTLADMVNAFTFGIQGKLDMNVQSFEKFSPLYIEQVMQSYARFRLGYKKEPEPQPLTDLEKIQIIRESIIKAFNDYKGSGRLLDFGSIIYTTLEKNGHINLSYDRKKEIYDQAERQYLEEQEKRILTPADNRNALRQGLFDLSAVGTTARIKQLARLIALKEYFDYLIEMEIDITEILT